MADRIVRQHEFGWMRIGPGPIGRVEESMNTKLIQLEDLKRLLLVAAALVLLMLGLPACGNKDNVAAKSEAVMTCDTNDGLGKRAAMREHEFDIVKDDAVWRSELTSEQYRIVRLKGTEPAFSGIYYNNKEPGVYRCVGCDAVLFRSQEKYDSGSGWPSFWSPAEDAKILEETDTSLGMVRTEVMCGRCGAHLGHVFPDGPRDKTGLRYCINSTALDFEPAAADEQP